MITTSITAGLISVASFLSVSLVTDMPMKSPATAFVTFFMLLYMNIFPVKMLRIPTNRSAPTRGPAGIFSFRKRKPPASAAAIVTKNHSNWVISSNLFYIPKTRFRTVSFSSISERESAVNPLFLSARKKAGLPVPGLPAVSFHDSVLAHSTI